MDINSWRPRLDELPLGAVHLFQEVESTNLEAEKLIQNGAPALSLVVADSQTAGRGRAGRSWITRPGQALAFSWILYPEAGRIQPETLGRLNGLAALAVCESLQEYYGLDAEIKWPNDVLVGGRKIAGILAEVHWDGCRLVDVILGIGVNVHRQALPKAEKFVFPATTLEDCWEGKASRLELLTQILRSLLKWHTRLAEPSLIQAWNASLAYKNQQVDISSPRGLLAKGELLGVEEDGSLTLLTERGETSHYHSGEIQVRLVDRS